MNNLFIMFAILVIGTISSTAQNAGWKFDRSHSAIKFTVSHMVVSEADGKFGDFTVSINSEKDDFSDANIDVSIKATTINTDDTKRDEHLRSGDFFDVANHPNITFKSKSMKKTGKGTYKLSGDFTMRGVTKPITLDVKYGGTQKSPWGNLVAGFRITGKINRKDYGVSWSKLLDQGGAVVGDVVDLVATVEFNK